MKCNVGKRDRVIRIIIGLAILISHYVYKINTAKKAGDKK
jgi:hypothetical protein